MGNCKQGVEHRGEIEFRGIRLGTVSKVPFFAPNMRQTFNDDYRIPVLIRIEPERLKMQLGENADVVEHLGELLKRGLRGSLKKKRENKRLTYRTVKNATILRFENDDTITVGAFINDRV